MTRFLTCVAFALAFSLCAAVSFAVTAKLCLDPGHGGTDSGAVGCGLYEKAANLDIQNVFRYVLYLDTNNGSGGGSWGYYPTRTSDVYVSLQGRCDISNNNGCNRFISSHCNACGCNATGTETFSYSGTGTGANMRNSFQSRALQAWGLTNRGNKTGNYYVLHYTNAPACMVETAFIDRCSPDAQKIGSSDARWTMGVYYLFAIQSHYGITPFQP